MLTESDAQKKLDQSPKERVTKEQIEARFVSTKFMRISKTVTVCHIELDNGYSVRGESACVCPENYDQDLGEKFAYDDAFRKLWPLFGFLLAERKYNESR